MRPNMTFAQVLNAVDAGIALHKIEESLTNTLYCADVYFAAGICQQQMANGRAVLDTLPGHDQKVIKNVASQAMVGGKLGLLITVNEFTHLHLVEYGESRTLITGDNRVVAEITGFGYNARIKIHLADGFIVSGETLMTHMEVDGVQRYLIKRRDPVDMLCCVIGLIHRGKW